MKKGRACVRAWRIGVGVAIVLTNGGCGGWVRSRFPDPNQETASIPEAQSQSEGTTASGADDPAPSESPVLGEELESSEWKMPQDPARSLIWGIWRSSAKDSTVPAEAGRMTEFLDGSSWRTLDSGSSSQAQGILAGGWADLNDPNRWRHDSGTQAPLFIVLDKNFVGQQIVGSLYESEVRDGMSRPVLKRERRLARLDPTNGRWFVPISEILGDGAIQWVTPHHQVTLHWELELANLQRVSVSTSFQIRLPPPQLSRLSQLGFQSILGNYLQDTQIRNRVLQEEVWQNPSQRELELWVSARSIGVGEVHEILKKVPELRRRDSPEVKWVETHLRSAALQALGGVETEGGRSIQGEVANSEGAWIRIRLQPGERVRVRWRGRVVQSDFPSGCSLNRKAKIELVWHSIDYGPRRCENGCDIRHSSPRTVTWSRLKSAVFGSVSTQAFVTEPLGIDLNEGFLRAGTDSKFLPFLESEERAAELSSGGWTLPAGGALDMPAWGCNEGSPEN